jgi:hypothetical protein
MIQRLTVDTPSLEQVLWALSLVQQLKEHVTQEFVTELEDGPLSELVETQQAIEAESVDLEAVLARVVGLARQLMLATGAAVWFFTERDFVCRAATAGFAEGEGLRLEVLARLVVSDVANRDRWESAVPARSLLVAPIRQGPNIVGALAVFSLAPNAFSERDVTRACLLSGLLAHALRKTADAELRQAVSVERAAMLEAMDQIMPALRRLAEDGGGGSGAGAGVVTAAEAELEPATERTLRPLPDALVGIPTEVATCEVADSIGSLVPGAEAEIEAARDASELPNVLLLLQEEPEREAKTPVVAKAKGLSEVEACAAAVEPAEQPGTQLRTQKMEARVPDEAATKASSGATRAGAPQAGKRRAASVKATMWWAAHRLEGMGSAVMVAVRSAAMHLQLVAARGLEAVIGQWSAVSSARLRRKRTPDVVAAVKSLLGASAKAESGKLPAAGKASWKRHRNVTIRAAGPVLVLLIMAAHLIMMGARGVPSHAQPAHDRRPALFTGASASATSPANEQSVRVASAKPHAAITVSGLQPPPGRTAGKSRRQEEGCQDHTAMGVGWGERARLPGIRCEGVLFHSQTPATANATREDHVKYYGEDVTVRLFTPKHAPALPPPPDGSTARPAEECTAGGLCAGGREMWPRNPQ